MKIILKTGEEYQCIKAQVMETSVIALLELALYLPTSSAVDPIVVDRKLTVVFDLKQVKEITNE